MNYFGNNTSSSITPTVIGPNGLTVALINSESKDKVLRDGQNGLIDNGFQHLVAIKESMRKN